MGTMSPPQIDRSRGRISSPKTNIQDTQRTQQQDSTRKGEKKGAPSKAVPNRPKDTFETSKLPPGAVRVDGRVVTPEQREAGRKAMIAGFNQLAREVANAQPPLSKEEVKKKADELRAKFFEVGYQNPGDGKLGNGLYTAVNTMATARQLLAENAEGAVDRARVMLNLTPHDPGYAQMPEVKQYIATRQGAKEGIDQARDSGSVNEGELGAMYRAWKDVADLTSATPTPKQQAEKMIAQLDAITAWAASKGGWTSSGKYDATVVEKAAHYSAELRRVLALDDSVAHVPAKEVQLSQALQNAKSEVLGALPKGEDPVKALNDRREAAFSMGERFAEAISAIPGPIGRVGGFVAKEIGVGLRLVSGDMTGTEAAARTVANGVESLLGGKIPFVKVPGGGLVSEAFTAAANKMVTSLVPDLIAIYENAKTNGSTREQITEAVTRAVAKALVESFKDAVFAIATGAKDLKWDEEDVRKVHEAVVTAADKWGVGQYVKKDIDDLLNLPKRYPEPK
jgi:hypothetical protein